MSSDLLPVADFPCLLCGARRLAPIRRYRVRTTAGRTLFGGSTLCVCPSCEFVQVVPPPAPAELAVYYSSAYWSSTHDGGALDDAQTFPKDNRVQFQRGRSLTTLIESTLPSKPARILDVGAGRGYVLHALGARYPGASRVAVEPSEACRRHLDTLGVQAVGDPIETFLASHPRHFDVIVLSHALEHFADPAAVLSLLWTSLQPAGVLCIEVPHAPANAEGLWHPWVSPFDEPHVSFFSPASLRRLVDAANFLTTFCETTGPMFRRASISQRVRSAVRASLRRVLPRTVLRSVSGQRRGTGEPDEAFFQYGGLRIWIRCVARRVVSAPTSPVLEGPDLGRA